MALGDLERAIDLQPGYALVVGTDSTMHREIRADFTNLVVLGPGVTTQRKIRDVGVLVMDGAGIRLERDARVDNARLSADGSATVVGDLRYSVSLVLEAGASLTVTGDLRCEADSGASLEPSATLDVHGRIRCPALE